MSSNSHSDQMRRPTPSEAASHMLGLIYVDSRRESWQYFKSKFGGAFCLQVEKELTRSKRGLELINTLKVMCSSAALPAGGDGA